ncbi:MAG: DMT family transporter [Actinomycetota bacterium]
MNRRAYLILAALAAIWGASYLFIKIALRDFGPFAVVGVRVTLGGLVLLALPVTRTTLRSLRGRYHLLLGLALAQVVLPFMLITLAERHVASSLAGILIATQPVLVAVLAPLFGHDRRVGWRIWSGLGMGLIGVVALLGLDLSSDSSALLAAGMILVAALSYAVAIFLLRRWMPDVSPIGASGAMLVMSSLLLLPATLATLPAHVPSVRAAISLVLLGVVGTGVAFLLYFVLLTDAGTGPAALVSYLTPPFSLVYGAVLLHEHITAAAMAGLALILVGAWLSTRRARVCSQDATANSGPDAAAGTPARPRESADCAA